MRTLFLNTMFLLVLLAALCVAETTAPARAGDVAEGVVVNRNNGLLLNTTPCRAPTESQYIQFHNPYRERDRQASCPNGSTYAKVNNQRQ
jgi:hypothetical protein